MTSSGLLHSIFTTNLDENILIQSDYIGWGIAISYITFIKGIGPRIMQDRKPFDLQVFMVVYNAVLFAINTYLAFSAIYFAFAVWPYRCDLGMVWKIMGMNTPFVVLSYFTKLTELLDTVIFILRKKFRQASFLHVYHHVTVFTLVWICLKYKLGGYYGLLMACVNFSIHMLLYTYYTVCALNPGSGKYLWWKKYITTIQIAQFFLYLSFIAYNVLNGCEKLEFTDFLIIPAMILMTGLLLHFYYVTYKVKKQ